MAWSYFAHLRPVLLGSAAHREAQETWLHAQFVADPAAGVAALREGRRLRLFPRASPLVLLPVLLSVGLACWRRRGFAAFVALAVAGLALALSCSGLFPLGASRHSLHLVAVQVAAGAAGVAWLVGADRPARAEPGRDPAHAGARASGWPVALSALLVGSVGTRVVLLARASASGAIDCRGRGTGDPADVHRTLSAFVRNAPPTVWITDMQTSMLLLPLVPREERILLPEPTFEGRRARGARALVRRRLALEPAGGARRPGRPGGARAGLDRRARRSPNGRVGVVTGGWGTSAAWCLAMDLRARGQDAAVLDAVGDERLAAVVVDVSALRAWRARRAQG